MRLATFSRVSACSSCTQASSTEIRCGVIDRKNSADNLQPDTDHHLYHRAVDKIKVSFEDHKRAHKIKSARSSAMKTPRREPP